MGVLTFEEALRSTTTVHKFDPDEPRDEDGRWSTTMSAKFTDREIYAVTNYQAEGYGQVNRFLAGREAGRPATLDGLDSAMKKSTLAKPTMLYRGINDLGGKFATDENVGKTLSYPNFLSTSKNADTAARMATEANDTPDSTGEMVMNIHVPAGAHAIDVERHTGQLPEEHEVLLDRGAKLHIASIDHFNKTVEAFLE